METKREWLLLSLAIVLSISCGHVCAEDPYDWKYLVYSQWWPQSQCYYKPNSDVMTDRSLYNDNVFRDNCVPEDVKGWTIHGLWPTVNGTPHPGYCNHSWPFDVNKIKDLTPKMMKQWLSFPDASFSESEKLWKHEWEKHGTCATSLPVLKSEHDYFNITLMLNLKYDLFNTFSNLSLVPSDKTYEVEQFEDAIRKKYDVKGRVICLEGPDGDQYLAGVRICLDKQFHPRDCLVTEPEKCRKGEPLRYPAIISPSSV